MRERWVSRGSRCPRVGGNVREEDVDSTAVELGRCDALLGLRVEAADGVCSGLGCDKAQGKGEESVFEVEMRHRGLWL